MNKLQIHSQKYRASLAEAYFTVKIVAGKLKMLIDFFYSFQIIYFKKCFFWVFVFSGDVPAVRDHILYGYRGYRITKDELNEGLDTAVLYGK